MRGRRSTDRGSESWLNDFLGVVVADSLVHLRGFVAIETKKQRSVERQDESFIGRNIGALLYRLGLNGKLLHGLERIDQVNALAEHVARNSAEQGQYSDISRGNRGGAGKEQEQQQNCDNDAQKTISETGKVRHGAMRAAQIEITASGSGHAFLSVPSWVELSAFRLQQSSYVAARSATWVEQEVLVTNNCFTGNPHPGNTTPISCVVCS